MKKVRTVKFLAWILVISFVPQMVLAEVVPSDGQPRAAQPAVSADIVPSDGQPRSTTPAVQGDIVPSDGQPRSTTPGVKGDIVPSDGQPRSATPGVKGDIVPSDGQPRSTTPNVKGDIVPSDGQPRKPTNAPAINPFVGEIAVGVSLLITYGPQIIALCATVATLAAAVNVVMGTGKNSFDLVKSIGQKLQRLTSIVTGPLSISNGTTQDGVKGLSDHLLQVTKFVNSNLSSPVSQVQDQVNTSLQMSKDLTAMAQRGKNIAMDVKSISDGTQSDLKKILAGGEVQLFRDGANKVAGAIGKQADASAGAFNQTITNTQMTTRTLEAMQASIDKALSASGKKAGEASLFDIKLSGAQLSKQLIDARKNMILSNKVLADNGKGVSGLHSEIISLLEDVKTEMEIFAQSNGVTQAQLDRLLKDKGFQADVAMPVQADKGKTAGSGRIAGEISFMIDDLARINKTNVTQMKQFEAQKAAKSESTAFVGANFGDDELYKKMVSQYKEYIGITSSDPSNKDGIEAARKNFEDAQKAYQESLQK